MDDLDEGRQGIDTPPYFSGTTFFNFIEAHRRTQPTRIDRSLMGSIAGGDQAKILRALRFFGLTEEDGTPTAAFESLHDLEGEDLQAAWVRMIRSAYPYLFSSFNLEKATQGQIEERFREQGIKGDTVRKAVAFFITLARLAGLKLSPYFKATRQRNTRPAGVRRAAAARAARRDPQATDASPPTVAPPPSVMPASRLHPAVQAWIDEMPDHESTWDANDFENWLAIFKASVKRAYKMRGSD